MEIKSKKKMEESLYIVDPFDENICVREVVGTERPSSQQQTT